MGSLVASTPGQPDFSKPLTFDLSNTKLNKTIDVGQNATGASADPFGSVLQLNAYHPIHGVILAAPYEQFDKARYYEPRYVRRYRTQMLRMLNDGEKGFGIRISDCQPVVSISHQTMDTAIITFSTTGGAEAHCVLTVHEDGSFSQHIKLTNNTQQPVTVGYALDLRISVHRASYGQLTEGGPVPLPDCENRLSINEDETVFTVSNRLLDANLLGRLFINNRPSTLNGLREDVAQGVLPKASTVQQFSILEPRSIMSLVAWFRLSPGLRSDSPAPSEAPAHNALFDGVDTIWNSASTAKSYVIRRNVDYILGNCSIPMSDEEVGMITDHVALPLGWNRDNYWQWRLLLKVRRNLDTLMTSVRREHYRRAMDSTLKGHLRWVFRRAERPHVFWHRSYIISGKAKDGPTFQLDQQCYPFLELSDYYQEFPEDTEFVKALLQEPAVAEVLELIVSKQDQSTGLFPTDETPGDDAVDHPFHFSSHVLLWYTLCRMVTVFRALGTPRGLDMNRLQSLANKLRTTSLEHFIREDKQSGEMRIAYLVDGQGQKTFYHDANDVPTVFAADWKFLTSERELEAWRNTMDFAVSKNNRLGYSAGGPFAGLGSVHSNGPWPLGYFQELLYAHRSGNQEARKDAAKRILGSMQWDGTFGEALDVLSGATTSKAWFSWPGSMIGAYLIDDGLDL